MRSSYLALKLNASWRRVISKHQPELHNREQSRQSLLGALLCDKASGSKRLLQSECVCSLFQIVHTRQESVERKWETATIIITAARRDARQGLQKKRTLPGVVVFCVREPRRDCTKWHAWRPPTTSRTALSLASKIIELCAA
jgi:hypothetical protein